MRDSDGSDGSVAQPIVMGVCIIYLFNDCERARAFNDRTSARARLSRCGRIGSHGKFSPQLMLNGKCGA